MAFIDFCILCARDDVIPNQLAKVIQVPFCVESLLSGVMESVAPDQRMIYRRSVNIPHDWRSKRLRLHFEAVDYQCIIFIDGKEVGRHSGGYDAFSVDIHDAITNIEDKLELTVEVTDPTQTQPIPVGKQWAGKF